MNTVTGRIIAILEPATGDSKKTPGTKWMRQEFVLETEEMYPRKVCFQLWGEDRIRMADIKMNDLVTVEFDIESREFNGRWYTSINGRTVTKGTSQGAAAFGPTPQSGAPMGGTQLPGTDNNFGGQAMDSNDDLPF